MSQNENWIVLVRPDGVGPGWWKSSSRPFAWDESSPSVMMMADFAWYTATEDGGFSACIDESAAVTGDDELAKRVEDWYEEHGEDPWPWQMRQVRLVD